MWKSKAGNSNKICIDPLDGSKCREVDDICEHHKLNCEVQNLKNNEGIYKCISGGENDYCQENLKTCEDYSSDCTSKPVSIEGSYICIQPAEGSEPESKCREVDNLCQYYTSECSDKRVSSNTKKCIEGDSTYCKEVDKTCTDYNSNCENKDVEVIGYICIEPESDTSNCREVADKCQNYKNSCSEKSTENSGNICIEPVSRGG